MSSKEAFEINETTINISKGLETFFRLHPRSTNLHLAMQILCLQNIAGFESARSQPGGRHIKINGPIHGPGEVCKDFTITYQMQSRHEVRQCPAQVCLAIVKQERY